MEGIEKEQTKKERGNEEKRNRVYIYIISLSMEC